MSLLKHTFLYTLARILPQFVGFFLLPLYTSVLSTNEYGIVESMYIFTMVLTIFFSLASERSMFRLYYDYKSELERKQFIGNLVIIVSLVSIVVLGILFLFSNQVSLIFKNIPFNPFFVYAIFTAFFTAFSFIPQTLYQVEKKPLKYLTLSVFSIISSNLIILYYLFFLEEGVIGFVKGRFYGVLIMFPIYVAIIIKSSRFRFSKELNKNILSFSLPMVPILLTAWVLNMSNRVFIEQYFSLAEVGIFSLAFKISSLATIVLGGLFTAFNPNFYSLANQQDKSDTKDKLEKLCNVISFLVFYVCFAVSLLSKEVILIFFNESYFEAISLVPFIVASIFFVNIGAFYNLMIYQEKKPKTIMYISITGAILSIVFNFLLVPSFSMLGAAIASIITAFYLLVVKSKYAKKGYFIKLPLMKYSIYFILSLIVVYFVTKIDFNIIYSFTIKCTVLIALLIMFYIKNKSIKKLIF